MVPAPANRRAEFLALARTLLASIPLAELTLADVARAAGVGWGTIRRHVGTREELIAALGDLAPSESGAPDTRRRLLDAARRTFARLGYDRASMDEIAAEAGLTKGALYWHFASKIELFKAIMAEQRTRELREMLDAPAIFRAAASLEEAWETLLVELLEDLERNSDWVWLIFEFLTSSRDSEIRDLMLEGSADINQKLFAQFKELHEAGFVLKDASPEYVALYWALIVNGLGVVFLVRPEFTANPHALAKPLARILLHGLQP